MPADASEPTPIDPDAILRQPFTTVRKGYDPLEVQKYLMSLAGELRLGKDRERDLERRLADANRRVQELENLSPQRLTSMLGEETAKVIEAANTAADDIRTKAEENVARLLRDAQDQAGRLRREAESVLERRTAEADEAAAAIAAQAEELLQRARVDAEAEAESGRERGREMVAEAQRARERLLRDLARRRKTLRLQIEQLQAGRERLVEAFAVVRRHLDESTSELDVVLPEAKAAADAALQRAIDESDEAFEDEMGELASEIAEAARPNGSSTEVAETVTTAPADDAEVTDEVVDELDLDEDPDAETTRPAGPKAPDPLTGRHSSAVKVIGPPPEPDPGAGSGTRVATLFARIKQEAEAEEVHGEAAARLIPTRSEGGGEAADPGADLADLAVDDRCARVLAELERGVQRHLKRELSDEQNEMLDAVRRERSTPSADAVLPDTEAHVERYANAAYAPLSDAAVAGGQLLPERARGPAPRVGNLARDVAAELAAELVAPLRSRLENCFVNCADDDDTTALSDALGASYREWRTQQVEPAAARAVVTAFNRGVLAAAAEGTRLRWHTESGTPCEDCARNAEGDPVVAGTPFPSGAEAPPLHATCRCLLVAEDA